ncbi:MAG: hypothetical protein NT166_04295 [Candidatus Aminicenantes bacterium]|nr:hypothetical protein [Candidatus Aminicenantes bacterium]
MSIDEYQLDDLDSLIDSIGEKKNSDSGPLKSPEPGNDESKTRELPLDKMNEMEEHPKPQEMPLEKSEKVYEPVKSPAKPTPTPPGLAPEREEGMRMPSPMRASTDSPNRTILYIALFLVVLLFFFMLRRCTSSPAPVTVTPDEETTSLTQKSGTYADDTQTPGQDQDTAKEKTQPVYDLPEEKLQGAAPLTVKPNGPVVSGTIDPEIAAVADALKIRVGIIEGSSTKTREGIATTISSGTFLGFRVAHTLQQRGGEVLRDEIAVTTPSRGQVTVKGNILDSMNKINYQTFLNDLKNAGLELIKNPLPDEGIINVQLRVTGSFGPAVNQDFLIGPSSVGPVELQMSIKKMESVLSKKYEVVSKRMVDEDKYYDTYKVLDLRGQPLFFVIGKNGKVSGIQLFSERFKTSRGLGIGNILGEFRVCYLKNGKMTISSTLAGIPFASTVGINARFFLQGRGLNFASQVFPDDLKISDILVGSSPFVK